MADTTAAILNANDPMSAILLKEDTLEIQFLRLQKYEIIKEIKEGEHPPEMIKELKRQKRILDSLIREKIMESKRDGLTGTSKDFKQNI